MYLNKNKGCHPLRIKLYERQVVSWFEHEAKLRNYRLGSSESIGLYRRVENQVKFWAVAQRAWEHIGQTQWTRLISIFGSGLHFEGENEIDLQVALRNKMETKSELRLCIINKFLTDDPNEQDYLHKNYQSPSPASQHLSFINGWLKGSNAKAQVYS